MKLIEFIVEKLNRYIRMIIESWSHMYNQALFRYTRIITL